MDIDFSERLKGFDEIWRRVSQHKSMAKANPSPRCLPKPSHNKQQSRARRFDPGHR